MKFDEIEILQRHTFCIDLIRMQFHEWSLYEYRSLRSKAHRRQVRILTEQRVEKDIWRNR